MVPPQFAGVSNAPGLDIKTTPTCHRVAKSMIPSLWSIAQGPRVSASNGSHLINNPYTIHTYGYHLPTWIVDLYGKGRVNIPYMDGMGNDDPLVFWPTKHNLSHPSKPRTIESSLLKTDLLERPSPSHCAEIAPTWLKRPRPSSKCCFVTRWEPPS